MDTHRIFISVNPPEDLKNAMEAIMTPFYKKHLIKIPAKKSWHITIAFMGNINEQEIEIVKDIVGRGVKQIKNITLSPSSVSFMPDKNPKMVWLNFKYSMEFMKLKNFIADEIEKEQTKGLFQDFKREKRSREPHMTLARFDNKHFHEFKNMLPKEGLNVQKKTMSFSPMSLRIMESHLEEEGAKYELVEEFSF